MSNRIKPREITQDADLQLLSSFGGLSSASYNSTGDVVYLDKLTNAYVNSRGEILKRAGSIVNTTIPIADNATGNGVHKFSFDNTLYMVAKVGTSVVLLCSTNGQTYTTYRTYTSIFPTKAADDVPSFATKIEGDYCHVLMAIANNQMISITLVKSVLVSAAKVGNTLTGQLSTPISGSVLNSTNVIVRQGNQTFQPASVSHSTANISITSANVPTLDTLKPIKLHSFFVLRFCDSQYLPGLYFNNSAVRKNQVALDVNVPVPTEIQQNPIVNEPSQSLSIESVQVYEGTTKRNKVGTPTTANDWNFSDGGYLVSAGAAPNQSPSFVAFGGFSALATSGSSTTVTMYRLRSTLTNGTIGNLKAYVDKTQKTPTYYDASASTITGVTLRPSYYSFANSSVNLAAVVELVDTSPTLWGVSNQTVVNLDPNDGALVIGDTYCIPLYGYNLMIRDGIYPDAIAFIGNRLVMATKDSRVVFSNADWYYRGISFNNCQVSTVNFSETSAFSVSIGQNTSSILAFTSNNTYAAIATNTGIFRVSSASNANKPANATDAVVTQVSSEVVPGVNSFTVFDNRIYYVSSNGMYALEFSEQVQELTNTSMSVNVSNKFTNVKSIAYVDEIRAFVISFSNTSELLAFNIDSESYYSIKFATPVKANVTSSSIQFVFAGESSTYLMVASFGKQLTTDFVNFSGVSFSIPQRSALVTHMPSSVDGLCTPAELASTIAPTQKLVVASGDNSVLLLGGGSVLLTEPDVTTINSSLVTKAFFGGRLDQSARVASVSLMLAGTGDLITSVFYPSNNYSDRTASFELWTLTDATYQGEPMLNAAYPSYGVRASAGNTNVIKLRQLGISESWQLALKLGNTLRLLGLQFETHVKSRKRLR